VTTPVRLVATDLDGTLLGLEDVVSERTRKAIRAVADAGIHVVAATGRCQWTAAPLVEPADGLDLVVCSNGASLYHLREQRSLASHPIADPVIDEILVTLAEKLPGCVFGWETDGDLHYEAGFLAYRPNLDRPASPDLAVGERPAAIRKLMVGHPDVQHYELLDVVFPLTPPGAFATTSGAPFVEITGEGVDKAFGVRKVCERLGVTSDEVIAIGDNHNDIAMVTWAGRGIAMGNAHPALLAVVDEQTTSNVEDGVAEVLESLV
jgi:hydroxymethylpyrimidine pyrophosphatase-like HAD family hydrolase